MSEAEKQAQATLAGYLAVHFHKNNLAMLLVNPSAKVRLLLSFVLTGLHQEMSLYAECIYYRSIITQCHLKVKEAVDQHHRGILSAKMVERMAFLYEKKASLAHTKLMELTVDA